MKIKKKFINNLDNVVSYNSVISNNTTSFDSRSYTYGRVKDYFYVFKQWAVVSHSSLIDFMKCQYPVLYSCTFYAYLSGKFVRCDICRLYEIFCYFKYDEVVSGKLYAAGVDLSNVMFERHFLALDNVPLPYGGIYNVDVEEVSPRVAAYQIKRREEIAAKEAKKKVKKQ